MDYQWLQSQFEANPQQSKAGLARALGLEPSAISKILANTRQIKAHEYNGMRKYFGLPVDGERSLQAASLSTAQPSSGLEDSDEIASADWAMPQDMVSAPFTLPEKITAYEVKKDTGSVRFCLGDRLLLDPTHPLSSTPEPFVICTGSEEIVALCHLDEQGMVHVQPFGGRKLSTRHKKDSVQVLGHIFSKMEII